MKNYFLVLGVFIAAALALAGSYKFFEIQYINDLEQSASDALSAGNYLASLEQYASLKNGKAPETLDVETKITESKNLLVAEEVLARAQKAKEDGEWFAVKALLEDGDATTNASFSQYEEAVALYLEAANKVKDLEEKIEAELAKFRQEAASEKARRETAEEKKEAVEEKIATVEAELKTTIQEKEQTSAALQVVTSEKIEAERQAARERFLKFLNEVELYANMLTRADGHLNDATKEIEDRRDISALIFLDRGSVLLDEVKGRTEELLANRTEEQYKGEVQTLLQSDTLLIVAARSFRDATFYVGRDDEKLTQFLGEGRAAKTEALRLLAAVNVFVRSSR